MENKKFSKRAVLTSIIVVILCCALLIGNTFAWFTDSAATGINTIESGSLDIEVLYAYPSDVVNGEIPDTAWKVVDEDTPVFNDEALWEPGYTEVVYFKYINKGNLSLQFQMHVDILKEVAGINVAGELFNLSDYIEAYVSASDEGLFRLYETREEALDPPFAPAEYHGTLKEVANLPVAVYDDPSTWLSLDTQNWLEPGEEYYTTLVMWMPEEVGNEANTKVGEVAPEIKLGINFVATQYNWEPEDDSYDHNYDKDAEYPTIPAPAIPEPAEDIVLGENYEAGETVSFANQVVNGKVTADKVFSQITFENVTGNAKIILNADNTVILQDCNFTLNDGEKLIVDNTGVTTTQVMYHNVTVNGVVLDSTNYTEYMSGVELFWKF